MYTVKEPNTVLTGIIITVILITLRTPLRSCIRYPIRSLKQRRFCSSEGQKHGPASHRHRISSHSSVGCAGLRQTQVPGLLSGFTTSLWWCGTHFLWPASLPKETLPMTTRDKAVFPAAPILLYQLPTKPFTVKCTMQW